MTALYAFLSGPALTASLLVFGAGMLWRAGRYVAGLGWRRDQLAYRPWSVRALGAAGWSVWDWLVCGTRSARGHRFLCFVSSLFHVSMILLLLFSPGHALLRREHIGFGFSMHPALANAVTCLALLALGLLILRRLLVRAVRFLTRWKDWLLFALCAGTLLSGLCARLDSGGAFRERLPEVSPWLLAHMACGEVLLILAPFLFSHMLFFFLSRMQIGLDFAIKRGGRKRGTGFPW